MSRRYGGVLVGLSLLLTTPNLVVAQKRLKKTIRHVIDNNKAAARSQDRVDAMADNTEQLLAEYHAVQKQIASLRVYNGQVGKLVASQRRQLAHLQKRIDNAAMVAREVTPLMLRMIDALEAFVKLDVPFLGEERRKRVASLKRMMDRSDVPDSEKFRRILEAYQVENEYGRTIEAYRGKVKLGNDVRTVDFLRFGRVALVYKTLDGREAYVWDPGRRGWSRLSSEHRTSIQKAFRIARKQAPPDLIRLPIPAPKLASGGKK
jgi:hypothetical protein